MAALEGSRSERQGLGITKKHYGRSYGSLQKSKQEIYIKHSVSETDTLQGIALKYGVTIEQIKRANKLFTTDSIFLRKVLNIPVGDQPLPAHLLENATASLNNGNDTTDTTPILQSTKDDSASESDKEGSDVIVESAIGVTVDAKTDSPAEVVDEEPRDETMDFFNRIDRHLRVMKTEVKRIEETSSVKEIEACSPRVTHRAAQYDYKSKSMPAYQSDHVIPTATYSTTNTGSPKIFSKARKLFGGREGNKKFTKADSQAEDLLESDQTGFYEL